jgi:putative MATE family efflux protein
MENAKVNPLATKPIGQLILKFALPSIVALLISAIYNIVDQIYIGHFIGTTAMAATNVAFPLTPIGTALALLFGIGGASNYNLALGRKEKVIANEIANTSVGMLFYVGLILGFLCVIFEIPMLNFFGTTPEINVYAIPYTRLISIGLPFFVFATGAATLVRADGSPNYAMLAMVVGAVFNFIGNPIFLLVFNMGITGIALSTLIGQILSAIVLVYYFIFKKKNMNINKACFKPYFRYLRNITGLGIASFFNQSAMTVVQIVMNNSLVFWGTQSIYGSEIPIAVVGAVSKLNIIFMAFAIGIAQGCQPIYGFNYGAQAYDRVEETLKKAVISVMIISVIFFSLFQLFPYQIISIFGQGDELYFSFAVRFLRIYMLMTIVNGLLPVCANFYTSIGKAMIGLWVSLTRQIIFLVPLILLLPNFLNIDGLIYAGPIADTMAFLLTVYFLQREWRELKTLQKNNERKHILD